MSIVEKVPIIPLDGFNVDATGKKSKSAKSYPASSSKSKSTGTATTGTNCLPSSQATNCDDGGGYSYEPEASGRRRGHLPGLGALEIVSRTAAWTDLGRIAGKTAQRGFYLSAWVGI